MPKFISRFGKFIHSAGLEANGLMGGGILSYALAFWQIIRGGSFSALALLAVSVVLFYLGAFKAWSKEHDLLLEEREKNGRPKIDIRLLKAMHHIFEQHDSSLHVGLSYVTLYVGLVNETQVATTINDYSLKIFIDDATFDGTLVPDNVRFCWAKDKTVEHSHLRKPLAIQKKQDIEIITPLSDKITSQNPISYLLEQKGYLHFFTNVPLFKWELEKDATPPAEFTFVLTLTDPKDGRHIGRFEKRQLEPANMRVIGSLGARLLQQEDGLSDKSGDSEGKPNRP